MTAWPELDRFLLAIGAVPSRTGSVVSTVYGDAVLPRGGSLALPDLLALMRRLGAADGVVRTAISRLAADGVLRGSRHGRNSAYALTARSRTEFTAAIPAIYGPLHRPDDPPLWLAFPADHGERDALDAEGYAAVAPATLVGFAPPPPGTVALRTAGPPEAEQALARRAWPDEALAAGFTGLSDALAPLSGHTPADPLDAMAARVMAIHAWRRLALRTPRLPIRLRQRGWPGETCRAICLSVYRSCAPASERWLDGCSAGPGPLGPGPDPVSRFSGGDTRP